MDDRKKEQMKIARILYDLGLDCELICAMTSLNEDEVKTIYQS